MTRIAALLAKELADLRGNPAVFVPALITGFFSIVMPFMIAVAVPYFTGEHLSDSSDFTIAAEMYQREPAARHLDPEGKIPGFALLFPKHAVGLRGLVASVERAGRIRTGEDIAVKVPRQSLWTV